MWRFLLWDMGMGKTGMAIGKRDAWLDGFRVHKLVYFEFCTVFYLALACLLDTPFHVTIQSSNETSTVVAVRKECINVKKGTFGDLCLGSYSTLEPGLGFSHTFQANVTVLPHCSSYSITSVVDP